MCIDRIRAAERHAAAAVRAYEAGHAHLAAVDLSLALHAIGDAMAALVKANAPQPMTVTETIAKAREVIESLRKGVP